MNKVNVVAIILNMIGWLVASSYITMPIWFVFTASLASYFGIYWIVNKISNIL